MNLPKKTILQFLIGAIVLTGGGFYAERLWSYESQCSTYEDVMVGHGSNLLDNVERGLELKLAGTPIDRALNFPELIALSVDVERILQEGSNTADEYVEMCGVDREDNFWRTDTRIDELRTRASDIGDRYRDLGLLPPLSQNIIEDYYR